jgi:hypothetical protein
MLLISKRIRNGVTFHLLTKGEVIRGLVCENRIDAPLASFDHFLAIVDSPYKKTFPLSLAIFPERQTFPTDEAGKLHTEPIAYVPKVFLGCRGGITDVRLSEVR